MLKSNMEKQNIIIFDGVCNFCCGAVNFIIKRDPNKKFKFTPMDSKLSTELLEKYDMKHIGKETIYLIIDDKCFYKSTAALEIAKELSGFWYIFNIFKIVPVRLRDFIYDIISKNRYKLFGKKDSCMIPTQDIKDRFIDID